MSDTAREPTPDEPGRRDRAAVAPGEQPDPRSRQARRAVLVAGFATALVATAAYVAGPVAFSNIDEYHARKFAGAFWPTFAELFVGDSTMGRFRPGYWVIQGALGAVTGSTATTLIVARLGFLAASVLAQVAIAVRLGASLPLASALALVFAWSQPALEVWGPGGPGEAYAHPLALACVLLLLRARGARAIVAAAALGLVAALVKETYGAFTAAALGTWAFVSLLHGRRGPPAWIALVGAALQLLPGVVALGVQPRSSPSYLAYLDTVTRVSPARMAALLLDVNLLSGALATLAVIAIVVRLARAHPRLWSMEDVLPVVLVAAALVVTIVLALVTPRYQLPAVAAFVTVAARAAASPSRARRGRAAQAALAAAAVLLLAPLAARAHMDARATVKDRAAEARLRSLIAQSLERYGAVRIFWQLVQGEEPIGAVRHLQCDGIGGEIEMRPCVPPPPAVREILGPMFAPYARPVTRPAMVIVGGTCMREGAPESHRSCRLQLPGLRVGWPRLVCEVARERATVVLRP